MEHTFRKRNDLLVFGRPSIEEDEIEEVIKTLRSGWIGPGPKVRRFEEMFVEYTGARYAVALESGTSSLFLALLIAGIGNGDEVITTPMTFCATANAIVHIGAVPIFADVYRDTFLIDPARIEDAITPKTKAIVAVHLGGRVCDMAQILRIAGKYGLVVIEDAAHCVEGWYQGKKVGNVGDMTCFSFYANKNVTTGKGGMITTNNEEREAKLRLYRDNGMSRSSWERFTAGEDTHYGVIVPGFNCTMTDLYASLGIHQLSRANDLLRRREQIWKEYDNALGSLPIVLPAPPEGDMMHARHLYSVLVDTRVCGISRDTFQQRLHDLNVGTGIHYVSLHLQDYYRNRFGFKTGDFPNAGYISERTISLPCFPGMTDEDVDYVILAVKRSLSQDPRAKGGEEERELPQSSSPTR